jgi:uncharacterized membrane protein
MEPDPTPSVALGFVLFALAHLGLAWPPVRQPLVARLGRWGFTALFSSVAWLTFGTALARYAAHAQAGPAGPALGAHPTARWVLIAAIVLGSALMTGAFARYARSPYGLAGGNVREPRGLERVTRHPFFVGFALFTAAHALLATRRVGAVMMVCLAVFALVGPALQDRKLLALRGEPHAAYLAATSLLPFVAIAAGRQQLVWRELPWAMLLLGVVLAWLLRAVHAHLFDHSGVYVIAAFVVGPLAILLGELRRDRRARQRATLVAGSS